MLYLHLKSYLNLTSVLPQVYLFEPLFYLIFNACSDGNLEPRLADAWTLGEAFLLTVRAFLFTVR